MYFEVEKKDNCNIMTEKLCMLSTIPHIHQHVEIVLLRSGRSLATADKKSGMIDAGDLYIAMPNQIHYYNDLIRPLDGEILIIPPDICEEYNSIFNRYIPETPIMEKAVDNPVIVDAIEKIKLYKEKENIFKRNELKGYCLILFREILKNMKLEEKKACDYNTVKDIAYYCYNNYMNDISLEKIAISLHISPYYVSHVFSDRLHVSFSEYINSLRIRKACMLLENEDISITELGYKVGYNSIRTFNRWFIQKTGKTPKDYRNEKAIKHSNGNII